MVVSRRRLFSGSAIAGTTVLVMATMVRAHRAAGRARSTATPTSALSGELEAFLRGEAEAGRFTGAALVVRGGETLMRSAHGYADRSADQLNTPETAFQIASITKMLTAAAVMTLIEAGEIGLDDAIRPFFTGWKHLGTDVEVTIRHLLGHTSGIPDFLTFYDLTDPFSWPGTLGELMATMADQPLAFTPGTAFLYSNTGYNLLGLLIEQVSGKTYEAYLRERVLTPAGMTETFLLEAPESSPPAIGYGTLNGATVGISFFSRVDLAFSAGGLTSTLDDLEAWNQALADGTVVPRSTIATMQQPGVGGYGLGFELSTLAGRPSAGHSGQTVGFRSTFAAFPGDDALHVLLVNNQDLDPDPIAEQLSEMMFRFVS